MSKDYDDNNRGALFRNDRATSDKHPTHTGKLNVDGRDYYINAWVKEGKKGKFFSLSVKPMDAAPEGHPERFQTPINRQRPTGIPERPQPRGGGMPDLGDDIPFAPFR